MNLEILVEYAGPAQEDGDRPLAQDLARLIQAHPSHRRRTRQRADEISPPHQNVSSDSLATNVDLDHHLDTLIDRLLAAASAE